MKNLITKLQNEAGLTKDQAQMAVGIFRDYLIECEDDPDLVEALKVKAGHVAKSAKSKYNDLTEQADEMAGNIQEKVSNISNKAGDKADEMLDKAKKKAKVVVDKLSKYLDE